VIYWSQHHVRLLFLAGITERREVVGHGDWASLRLRHKQPTNVLREVQMTGWLRTRSIRQIGRLLQSQRVRPISVVLALFFLMPPAALAQGSPFDTGFTAIQSLFTGTIAKVASLVAIVIGGYGFAHGEPGAKKALAGVAAGTGIAVLAVNVLSWLWGV
jgi:type IV secretory pathway VirB2 component (pilin)